MNSLENVMSLYNTLCSELNYPKQCELIDNEQKLANILEVIYYKLTDFQVQISNLSNKLLR